MARTRTRNARATWAVGLGLTLIQIAFPGVESGEAELKNLMDKMELDVQEYATAIETTYSEKRCSDVTLDDCARANYEQCRSEHAGQTCKGGSQFTISQCGDGTECSGLFSESVTTVRIPEEAADGVDGNPTDKRVIESICTTLQTEEWMTEKYNNDASYWAEKGVASPQSHFGGVFGDFRIFPGRHSKTCGTYDPRVRPWYVAASSGPKDVILVLDTSGSMSNSNNRLLNLMKQAAKRIVRTLTIADRVAIVEFNTDAKLAESNLATSPVSGMLIEASKENIEKLVQGIDAFTAGGKTNFLDSFRLAFDTMERTMEYELHSGCNSAIVFLTDGEMSNDAPVGVTDQQVIDLIKSRKAGIEAETGKSMYIFSYSVGQGSKVHTLPREIACESDGIWSKIDDEYELVNKMGSYYKLFSLGLGEAENKDFKAWVEPYTFHTGNWEGTTVSAPVYDTAVTPAILIGVVGIDFTTAAMNAAYGGDAAESKVLEKIAAQSIAFCPKVNLTTLELESIRRQGGGDEALCTDEFENSDFVGLEPAQCGSVSDYPDYLWINNLLHGQSYEDRVCCLVGESSTSDQCPAVGEEDEDGGSSTGVIVGIAVAAAVVVCVAGCSYYNRKRSSGAPATTPVSPSSDKPASGLTSNQQSPAVPSPGDIEIPIQVEQPVVIAPPPSFNPHYSATAPPMARE